MSIVQLTKNCFIQDNLPVRRINLNNLDLLALPIVTQSEWDSYIKAQGDLAFVIPNKVLVQVSPTNFLGVRLVSQHHFYVELLVTTTSAAWVTNNVFTDTSNYVFRVDAVIMCKQTGTNNYFTTRLVAGGSAQGGVYTATFSGSLDPSTNMAPLPAFSFVYSGGTLRFRVNSSTPRTLQWTCCFDVYLMPA